MTTIDAFPEARVDPTEDVDRRYTTRPTMALCMALAGVNAWDLDVAADDESHWALRWYGIHSDGLRQRWEGPRVWCNPPYSSIEPWVLKAWKASSECEVIAMLLPGNRQEQPWWQEHVEPFRDGAADRNWKRMHLDNDQRFSSLAPRLTSHYLPGRVAFGHPGNRDAVGVGSPAFGSILLVWRQS